MQPLVAHSTFVLYVPIWCRFLFLEMNSARQPSRVFVAVSLKPRQVPNAGFCLPQHGEMVHLATKLLYFGQWLTVRTWCFHFWKSQWCSKVSRWSRGKSEINVFSKILILRKFSAWCMLFSLQLWPSTSGCTRISFCLHTEIDTATEGRPVG